VNQILIEVSGQGLFGVEPDVIFSFLSLRFSLIVRFAFFFDSRLPLSRFPFSPINNLPDVNQTTCTTIIALKISRSWTVLINPLGFS
jgi:hypothetical protein